MLSTTTFYILKPLSVSIGYQCKPAINAPSSGHKFLESQKPGEAMQTSFFSIARALMCNQKPDFLILWFSPTVNFSFPPHPQRKEKKKSIVLTVWKKLRSCAPKHTVLFLGCTCHACKFMSFLNACHPHWNVSAMRVDTKSALFISIFPVSIYLAHTVSSYLENWQIPFKITLVQHSYLEDMKTESVSHSWKWFPQDCTC